MRFLYRYPATLGLVVLNTIVFIYSYSHVGTFENPRWTLGLLHLGAEFNPFILSGQWYRLLTHMFLHGHIAHLAFNMYALFAIGSEVEESVGLKKFLFVYLLTGFGAALVSLYWNLFTIGVGASGAIFGLFGFDFVLRLTDSRQNQQPVVPLLVNFVLFLGINLAFGSALHADNAAHFGGLATGVLLGTVSALRHSYREILGEWVLLPILIIICAYLPRYQVQYYNFFQDVLAAEDSTLHVFDKNMPDAAYVSALKRQYPLWDSARTRLDKIQYIPVALQEDTFKLKKYIQLRKLENLFRTKMIEQESFVLMDSIEMVQSQMDSVQTLDYPLAFREQENEPEPTPAPPRHNEMVRILYDSNWEEIPFPPFSYYRLGYKDSVGRWQGPVRDFYADGSIQMKGALKDDKRNGIFIYYSDHKTYESAGRYVNDQRVGKWESYHPNGKLESEVYYTNRYFLKTLFDAAGHQLVKDGEGKEIHFHPNGVVALEGMYKDGNREGYWYGRYPDGTMYFEENYNRGRLVNGRSRSRDGSIYNYDASSQFPIPVGGQKKLDAYLRQAAVQAHPDQHGTVSVSFRVTRFGQLVEFNIEKGLTPELNATAMQIIKEGPAWLPAKTHGIEPEEGYAFVTITF